MIHVIHHDDLDGQCAAAIVLHFTDALNNEYRLIEKTYDSPVKIDSKFKEEDTVYIVDYSIAPDDLIALSKRVANVTMIDHHKTTIHRYEDFFEKYHYDASDGIQIHLDDSMAACELTYLKLSRGKENPRENISWPAIRDRTRLPRWIQLLGDFDTYKFKFSYETRQFHWGMMARDTKPDSMFWYDLMSDTISLRQIRAEGEVIARYQNMQDERDVLARGFFVEWEMYNCFVFNGARGGGKLKNIAPKADIWISFRLVAENDYEVSLYSANGGVDVSEVAAKYWFNGVQGGGHPGASGFHCSYPPFLEKKDE